MSVDELTQHHRAILDLEARVVPMAGAKEAAIRDAFDIARPGTPSS